MTSSATAATSPAQRNSPSPEENAAASLTALKREPLPLSPTSLKRPRANMIRQEKNDRKVRRKELSVVQTVEDKGCRYDSSLGLLTTKFVNLLKESDDGVLDLNKAAEKLHVQKRRIYDITNVLEGIGIIEKKSKNNIKWRHQVDAARTSQQELASLQVEFEALKTEENNLDEQIASMQTRLRELASGEHCGAYAYVTHSDIKSIPELRGDTLIAIKAPPGTELEVPDPDQGMPYGERRYQIYLKSSSGPIDCLLVSQGGEDHAIHPQSPLSPAVDHGLSLPNPSVPNESPVPSVLHPDDDQDMMMGVLRLSPPQAEHEFFFALDDAGLKENRGIADLYDDVFTDADSKPLTDPSTAGAGADDIHVQPQQEKLHS